MKNWTPVEWSLFILTLTVPGVLIATLVIRAITGTAASEQGSVLLADLLKVITGGVLGIIGSKFNSKKDAR